MSTPGLAEIEPLDFAYTSTSLNDVYALSFDHALELLEASGGHVEGDTVRIPIQQPQRVLLEVSFEGIYPIDQHHPVNRRTPLSLRDEAEFAFDGVGFVVDGWAASLDGEYHVLGIEVYIDGVLT